MFKHNVDNKKNNFNILYHSIVQRNCVLNKFSEELCKKWETFLQSVTIIG